MSVIAQLRGYIPPPDVPKQTISPEEAAGIFGQWQRDEWFVDAWLLAPLLGFGTRVVGQLESGHVLYVAGYGGAVLILPDGFLTKAISAEVELTERGPRLTFTYDDRHLLVLLGIEPVGGEVSPSRAEDSQQSVGGDEGNLDCGQR